MANHFLHFAVFLVIYAISAGFFTGSEMLILLTIHFGIAVISHLRQKTILITPLLLFYIGVIIVNIANLNLISQVEARDVRTYTYIIPKYIDQAVLIWCISSTLCALGYQLAGKRGLARIYFELNKDVIITYLFWILLIAPVMICASTSKRNPCSPTGFLTPSCPSSVKLRAIT